MANEHYEWKKFFEEAEIEPSDIDSYVSIFEACRVRIDTLLDFTDAEFKEMGITIIGDRKAIFKHARKVKKSKTTAAAATASDVPSPSKNSPPITPPKPKKSRVNEFIDENKDAKSVTEVVAKASAIIRDLEKDWETAVKKINAIEWPNNVRAIIFDVEGDLNLSSLVVCFQCGEVHDPHCKVNKATSKYPTEAKSQRIFLRRQRWIYAFIYLNNNPRIQKIILALQIKFNEIVVRANKQEELNEAETFISSLNDLNSLIFWFCQMVAEVFEELSNSAKTIGSTSEVEDLSIFAAPNNLLATILVNSSIILKADGEVVLKSNANVMASKFMPKRK